MAAANRYLASASTFNGELPRVPTDLPTFVSLWPSISSRSFESIPIAWLTATMSSPQSAPPCNSGGPCAGLRVFVRRHLNGPSAWCGPRWQTCLNAHSQSLCAT